MNHKTPKEWNGMRQGWKMYQWPIVWGAGAVAFVLGWLGYAEYSVAHHEPATVLDDFYATLQMFVLSSTLTHPIGWKLEVARFLAPTVLGYTAAQAFVVLFQEQLRLLRLVYTRNHVVVCGLGRRGFQFVRDFRARGDVVVVIEANAKNEHLPSCRNLGAIVLTGDAADEVLLRQAHVERAQRLIAICDDDGTNVEIAVRAYQIVEAGSAKAGMVRCHVHIVDPELRTLFKQHQIFTETGDRFVAGLFDSYEAGARQLFDSQPLDREPITADDGRTVHLIIVGFEHMGESVALQAARIGHYANGRKIRITVVDKNAEKRRRQFYSHYPQINQVCDMEFMHHDVEDPSVFANLEAWCDEAGAIPTVVCCFDDDSRSLSFALRLLPKLKERQTPLLVRMADNTGLASLLGSGSKASALLKHVHAFGMITDNYTKEMLLLERRDLLAQAIHQDYRMKRLAMGDPADAPSLQSWQQLDDALKASNRQQADHLPVKLRAIGCRAAPKCEGQNAVAAFTDAEIELLARMEHARRHAERWLSAWSCAPDPLNLEKQSSPNPAAWGELSDAAKARDREAVKSIFRALELTGQQVCRA